MRLRDFDPDPSRQGIACRSGYAAGRSCPSVGRIRCARRTARSASGRTIRTPDPDDREQAAESFGDCNRYCVRGQSPPPFGGPVRAMMSEGPPHRLETERKSAPAGRSERKGRIERESRATEPCGVPIDRFPTSRPLSSPANQARGPFGSELPTRILEMARATHIAPAPKPA